MGVLEFCLGILEFFFSSLLEILEFSVGILNFSLGILEFPKSCVIPRLDRGISSQNRDSRVKPEDDIVGNLEFP